MPAVSLEVLDADRQTVEKAKLATRHDGGFRLGRLLAGAVEAAGDHGVHGAVDRFDLPDAGVDQFTGGDFLGADHPAQGDGIEFAKVLGAHSDGVPRFLSRN